MILIYITLIFSKFVSFDIKKTFGCIKMDFIANAPYGMTYKEFYNIYNGKIIHKEPLCLIEIISHDNVIETENNIYNISNIDESQSNLQLSKKSVSQSNVLSKVYFYEKNINPEINDHLILSSNNNQVLPIQNVYELPAINNYSKNVEFYNNQSNEHLNIILEGEKENSNNFNDDQSNKNDNIIFEVMDPSEEDICISDIINTHLNEQKEFSIYYENNKNCIFDLLFETPSLSNTDISIKDDAFSNSLSDLYHTSNDHIEEPSFVDYDIQSTILNNENEEIVENFITVPDMEELTVVNHDIQSTILNNENEEIVENFITVPDMEELTVVNHDIQSAILNNENEEIVENFITVPDIEEPSIVEHIDHHINLKEEILNNNKDFDTKPVLISKEEFSKIILQEGKSFDIEENILINKIKHKESVILENKIIRDQDSNVYNENTHSLFHSRLMRLRDKFFQETEALRFISSIDKFINDIENIDFSSITEDQKESFIEQAKKYIKKAKELSKKKNHKKHYDLGYLSTILSFRLEGLKNIPTNKMKNKRLIYENLQNISNVLSDLNKDLQDTKDNNNVKKEFSKKNDVNLDLMDNKLSNMYVQLKNVNDKLTDNIKSSIKKNDILLELLKRNIDDNYTEQSSFDDNKKEEKGINKIIYESNVESCQNLEGLKYQSENNVILKNFLPHSEDNELYDLLCNIEKNCEFVVDSFCKINEQEKNGENVKENDDKNNINLENENLEIVDENKLELKIKENNINLEDENLEIVDGNKIDLKIEKNCEENNVKLKNEHLENFDENNLNTDEIYSDFKVKQIENIDENLDKISSKKKNLKEFIFNDEFIDDILINETPNEQLLNSSSSESTSSSIKSKDLEILKNLLQENKKIKKNSDDSGVSSSSLNDFFKHINPLSNKNLKSTDIIVLDIENKQNSGDSSSLEDFNENEILDKKQENNDMGIFENKSSESSLTGSPYTSTSPTQSSKHSTDIVSSSPDISVDLEENDNNNEINLINKSMEKEIAQISSSSTSSPTSSSDEINISDKIHNKKYQRKHISSEAKHVFDEAKFNLEKLTLIDELDNQHIAPLVKNVKDNYEYALNVIKKTNERHKEFEIKSKSLDRFMFLSEDDLSQNNSEKSGRKRIIRNLSGSESSNRFKNIPSFNNKDEPFIENETDYKKNQSDISDSKSCVKTILDHEKNSIKDLFNNETEEKSNTVNFIDSLIKNYDYEDIVDKIVEKIYRSQEEQNLDDTDCIFDKKEDEKRENVEQLIPTQIFNNQEILSDINNLEEGKNVQEFLDNTNTNNFENITDMINLEESKNVQESLDNTSTNNFENITDMINLEESKNVQESLDNTSTNNFENITGMINLEESKNVQESLDNTSTDNFKNITGMINLDNEIDKEINLLANSKIKKITNDFIQSEKPYEQKQEYNSKTQRFIEFNENFDVVLDDEFKNLDDLPVAVQTKKLLESESNYDDKNLYDTSILNDLIKKSEDDDLFAKELNDDLIKKTENNTTSPILKSNDVIVKKIKFNDEVIAIIERDENNLQHTPSLNLYENDIQISKSILKKNGNDKLQDKNLENKHVVNNVFGRNDSFLEDSYSDSSFLTDKIDEIKDISNETATIFDKINENNITTVNNYHNKTDENLNQNTTIYNDESDASLNMVDEIKEHEITEKIILKNTGAIPKKKTKFMKLIQNGSYDLSQNVLNFKYDKSQKYSDLKNDDHLNCAQIIESDKANVNNYSSITDNYSNLDNTHDKNFVIDEFPDESKEKIENFNSKIKKLYNNRQSLSSKFRANKRDKLHIKEKQITEL